MLRPRRVRLAMLAAAPAILVAAAASADTVERRGRAPSLEGTVERVDASGVSVRSRSGAVQVVPLDRVRDVVLEQPDTRRADWERVRESAEQLWRARSRVERGDT